MSTLSRAVSRPGSQKDSVFLCSSSDKTHYPHLLLKGDSFITLALIDQLVPLQLLGNLGDLEVIFLGKEVI